MFIGAWAMPANWPDLVNSLFELCGAPFILLSVVRLYKDKQVKGVSWAHAGFFATWGYWNLFFYPHLGQWLSFCGGVAIVIVNTFWMGQLVYYSVVFPRKRCPCGKWAPLFDGSNICKNCGCVCPIE